MARTKTGTPPKYRHHKARNLAKVTIDRIDIYLGEFESAESWQQYAKVLAAWRQNMAGVDIKALIKGEKSVESDHEITASLLTFGKLSIRYWNEHASEYFKSSTGLSRGRVANCKAAMKATNDLYADLPVNEFTPVEYRDVRDSLVARELSRRYVNDTMRYVIDLFRWGVEFNLVRPQIPAALREVASLRAGKSTARESDPIESADPAIVEETLKHLQPVLRDMAQVQLLTGARPIEVCQMKKSEITMQLDGVWCYRPSKHKTIHRGKQRRLFLGPEAQRIVRPYLEKYESDYIFTHRWKGDPKRSSEKITPGRSSVCVSAMACQFGLRINSGTYVQHRFEPIMI